MIQTDRLRNLEELKVYSREDCEAIYDVEVSCAPPCSVQISNCAVGHQDFVHFCFRSNCPLRDIP